MVHTTVSRTIRQSSEAALADRRPSQLPLATGAIEAAAAAAAEREAARAARAYEADAALLRQLRMALREVCLVTQARCLTPTHDPAAVRGSGHFGTPDEFPASYGCLLLLHRCRICASTFSAEARARWQLGCEMSTGLCWYNLACPQWHRPQEAASCACQVYPRFRSAP